MHPTPPELGQRDAALWRVGRNLERLQSIEKLLKSLLPTTRLSGTRRQIETQILDSKRAAKKATLGTLTDQYARHVLSPPSETEDPEVGSEILFSFSMSVDAPPEVLKQMRADWRRLTKERNQLVHSVTLADRMSSFEGCVAFCQQLDEEYQRASLLLEELDHQVKTRQLAATAFKELHESGQLQKLGVEPPSDA